MGLQQSFRTRLQYVGVECLAVVFVRGERLKWVRVEILDHMTDITHLWKKDSALIILLGTAISGHGVGHMKERERENERARGQHHYVPITVYLP